MATLDPAEQLSRAQKLFRHAPLWPAERLEAFQQKRLRLLLDHAASKVPFYRDLWRQAGIEIDTIREAEDLWRLPVVDKEAFLNARAEELLAEGAHPDKLNRRTSSGSLGRTMTFYQSPGESLRSYGAMWSAWIGRGVTREDRILMLGPPYLATIPDGWDVAFVAAEVPAAQARERLLAFNPTVLIGSTEAISLVARDLLQTGHGKNRTVRLILPFGQTLSPFLREWMNAGFEAEILDIYGCSEAGWLGIECEEHQGLHVPAERVIVQIAKLGQPDVPAASGEVGEVIITFLEHHTMPFIRYRLSDVAALDPSPCACGRNGPRIVSLEGRVQDLLVSVSGKWVSPCSIQYSLAYGFEVIEDLRVVQESPTRAKVSLVLGEPMSEKIQTHVEQALRGLLGETLEVEIEVVDVIPREVAWKRRRIHRAFPLEDALADNASGPRPAA